jgi:hypothetical protein
MGPFYYLFLIGGADGIIDPGGLLKQEKMECGLFILFELNIFCCSADNTNRLSAA